jgi:prepilin-type N-terminal cleavage/methylation domain-containing protein
MNSKGFTLPEVIIALVVLTSSVVSFAAAYNMYITSYYKQELYQDIYITAMSVKNIIEFKRLVDDPEGNGKLNGFSYSYKTKIIKSAHNYIYPEYPMPGGNIGPYELTLYEVDCILTRDQWKKEYSFYVTQFTANPAALKAF